ncbi:MAG TPA: hypothetical protein VIG30_09355 [Ktedonobacterales bacterium]|jgi:hypothetical protein
MRCAECERSITNADMWQLCNNPLAPTSRSMELLCWDCRLVPPPAARAGGAPRSGVDVVAQAIEVVRAYLSRA